MQYEVAKSPAEVCPLLPGMEIPHLVLPADDGGDLNLNDAVALKPAVLVFYRGGW